MENFNSIYFFIELYKLRSFTAVAKKLKVNKSTVSRVVKKLEDELGTHLVKRNSQKVEMTSQGEKLFLKLAPSFKNIKDNIQSIIHPEQLKQSTIKLTAPLDLSESILPELILEFKKKYPEIKFNIIATNRYMNLLRDDLDLAFRIGKLQDSDLMQRTIASVKLLIVGNRKFKYDLNTLSDLKKYKFYAHESWTKISSFKKTKLRPKIISNNFNVLLSLARVEKCIIMIPSFLAKPYIDSRELKVFFKEKTLNENPLQIIYPRSQHTSFVIKDFINFSIKYIKEIM